MKNYLNINATNQEGKKTTTTISNVNSNVSNATMEQFAQMLNSLTTNTYADSERVDKIPTSEEIPHGGQAKPLPTLEIGEWTKKNYSLVDPEDHDTEIPLISYETPITYDGDGELSVTTNIQGYHVEYINNETKTLIIVIPLAPDSNYYFTGVLTAAEGDTFASAKAFFTYTFTDEYPHL